MDNSTSRAKYETQLARAAQALRNAHVCADQLGLRGAVDDIEELGYEISRLLDDSLSNKRSGPTLNQLGLWGGLQ
jgi:hypothetical protein